MRWAHPDEYAEIQAAKTTRLKRKMRKLRGSHWPYYDHPET